MGATPSRLTALAVAAIAMGILGAGSATAAPSVSATNVRAETTTTPPQAVRGSFVKFVNNTPDTVFVRQVEGGRPNLPGGDPQVLHPGQGLHLSGSNQIDDLDIADVRIRIYEAVKDMDQRDHPGRLLQVVTATNSAFDYPAVSVHKDPYVQPNDGKTYNKVFKKRLSTKESYDFTQGGTWTHAHREIDSPDHKVFVVKIYQLPTQAIEDRPVDPTSPVDVI